MPPAFQVLFRALTLSLASGYSEIGIDQLLAALEPEFVPAMLEEPKPQLQLPHPRQDLPLSPAAIAALSSAGNIETLSLDRLKDVLLAAKSQQSERPI